MLTLMPRSGSRTPDSGRLPASLAAARWHLARRRTAVFPWSPERRFAADAPDLKLAAPELTILGAEAMGGKVRYDVKLASPRGAPEMSVVFPVSAGVTAIEVAGHALEEPSGRVLEYLAERGAWVEILRDSDCGRGWRGDEIYGCECVAGGSLCWRQIVFVAAGRVGDRAGAACGYGVFAGWRRDVGYAAGED